MELHATPFVTSEEVAETENKSDQDSKSSASTELHEIYEDPEVDSDVEDHYSSDQVDAWDTGCTEADTCENMYYDDETQTTITCSSFERKVLLSNRSRDVLVKSHRRIGHLQADIGTSCTDITKCEDTLMLMQENSFDFLENSVYKRLRTQLAGLTADRNGLQ